MIYLGGGKTRPQEVGPVSNMLGRKERNHALDLEFVQNAGREGKFLHSDTVKTILVYRIREDLLVYDRK